MKRKEAIRWLEAILADTLEPDDDRDAGRVEAVKLAIQVLKKPAKTWKFQLAPSQPHHRRSRR